MKKLLLEKSFINLFIVGIEAFFIEITFKEYRAELTVTRGKLK